jgi:energy-coupling factor transport system ATP-binding protein
MNSEGITLLDGPNFSGRTTWARNAVGLPGIPTFTGSQTMIPCSEIRQRVGSYVGPDVVSSLTGLVGTVSSELQLQARACKREVLQRSASYAIMEGLGLLRRNPFTLSGGEQALVAIAAACLAGERVVAIDTAIEQLASDFVQASVADLHAFASDGRSAVVIDNRAYDTLGGSIQNVVRFTNTWTPFNLRPEALKQQVASMRLSVRGLRFSYNKNKDILSNADADLEPGHIYHLRGRNGAGKSTLAKILAGLLRPTGGEILADGVRIRPWRKPASVVAYHFQNPDHQLFRSTVREELASCNLNGSRSQEVLQTVSAAFGLDTHLYTHPLDLPYTLRKRVALAASISMQRPWLILDEPTLGQDAQASGDIAEILRMLAGEGAGIILISHSSELPKSLGCSLIELRGGTIHARQ